VAYFLVFAGFLYPGAVVAALKRHFGVGISFLLLQPFSDSVLHGFFYSRCQSDVSPVAFGPRIFFSLGRFCVSTRAPPATLMGTSKNFSFFLLTFQYHHRAHLLLARPNPFPVFASFM